MSEENASAEVVEESAPAEEIVESAEELVEDSGEELAEDSGEESLAEASEDLSDEELDAVEEAIEDGATAEEVRELIETFKIKVNGQEKEVTLDFNNKEDIVRRLQMAEAAQEAFQKASQIEKAHMSEVERLKANPWEVLSELGFDPDELAEERIEQLVREMSMSPEEKAAREADLERQKQQEELETLRRQLKEKEEAEKSREFEILQQQAKADLEVEIDDAISGTTQLPKSDYVQKRVADALMFAMENGQPKAKAHDVAPIVEKEIKAELQQFMENVPDQLLEEFFGKKLNDRLRKQRLKKMPAQKKIVDSGKNVAKKDEKREKININDWLKGKKSLS